jgi:hypothetical protein
MNLTHEQKHLLLRLLDIAQGVHSIPDAETNAAQTGKMIFEEMLRMDRGYILQIIREINNSL